MYISKMKARKARKIRIQVALIVVGLVLFTVYGLWINYLLLS